MKKNKWLRTVALVAALGVFSTSVSCGYFLYPKRRGNKGGGLHTPTLVMDLLWLLPGIIPGVVALAVDFSTGAIYMSKGGKAPVAVEGVKSSSMVNPIPQALILTGIVVAVSTTAVALAL